MILDCQAAGIRRIVSRRPFNIDRVVTISSHLGIELAVVPDDDAANTRRANLVAKTLGEDQTAERDRVQDDRKERKRAKLAYAEMKKAAAIVESS